MKKSNKQELEEEEALLVGTALKGQRKIEMVGFEKNYNWRKDCTTLL